MIGEIICVGNELLIGDTLNTNTQYLSQQLTLLGVEVAYQSVVGDDEIRLNEAIDLAKRRSDIIIFSGGLGPTYDDMTKETLAENIGEELVQDSDALAQMTSFFERRGRQMAESNLKQALRPKTGRCLTNNNGTAPGIYVEKDSKHFILLPGPPNELKPMFQETVVAIIEGLSEQIITSRIFKLVGIGESDLAMKIGHIMDVSTNPRIAPYAKLGSVNIRLTASSSSVEEGNELIEATSKRLEPFLEDFCYTIEDKELEEVVVDLLLAKGLTIATAESCTGGLLSARLVQVSGVSSVFNNGFVTYANEAKEKWLGVQPQLLKEYGAVSEEVAKSMATGVRIVSGASIGVSITGIAGPNGGTVDKPVGTVHIAVAYENNVFHKKLNLNGLRQKIRDYSAQSALVLLYKILK